MNFLQPFSSSKVHGPTPPLATEVASLIQKVTLDLPSHIRGLVKVNKRKTVLNLRILINKVIKITNKTISLLIFLPLLFSSPLFSHADTIILKDGTRLETKRSWEKNGKLMFYMEDLVTSINKRDVERIEKANSDQKVSPHFEKAEAADFGTSDGFRSLTWGSELSDIAGMAETETDTGLAGVVEYIRPNDVLQIGEAELTNIIYSFWHDQLYTVTIWTQNYSNYEALRSAAFERFGEGSRRNEAIERYIWPDKLTDRMLEYIKEGEHGMLWMRSRDLDRKLKLSKYDASISYIKWLRSRELERKQTAASSSFLQEDSDSAEQENRIQKTSP